MDPFEEFEPEESVEDKSPVQNCWEHYRCGRESGGSRSHELGVCPATVDKTLDGTNRGRSGGRYCWRVCGTLCGGQVRGEFAKKLMDCLRCTFFLKVREEENKRFRL